MSRDGLHIVRALRSIFESRNSARRNLVWAAIFGAVLLFFLFVIGGNYGIINIINLRRERKVLEKRIAALTLELDSLKAETEKLKYDKREIERVARELYGMAKPGEKVVKFVDPRDTLRHP